MSEFRAGRAGSDGFAPYLGADYTAFGGNLNHGQIVNHHAGDAPASAERQENRIDSAPACR